MNQDLVAFQITKLAAAVPEGLPIEWQGRELSSGPLTIELDENTSGRGNQGVLDYSRRRAQAEFHVRLQFLELASSLEDLGVNIALTHPVRAVLRSEGEILEDHSFFLSGRCELQPHALLTPENTMASVLPGT